MCTILALTSTKCSYNKQTSCHSRPLRLFSETSDYRELLASHSWAQKWDSFQQKHFLLEAKMPFIGTARKRTLTAISTIITKPLQK